ncbi:MAG: putative nucleotidyltransferase [Halobacteriales archaeon]|jgi:predicted nucleotidyltransferase
MNSKTVLTADEPEGIHVCLPVPVPDPGIFNHDSTAGILQLLVDNPDRSFTNRELHRITGKGLGNVNSAVRGLEALDVVTVERDGRSNQVRINASKVVRPQDRITAIPQEEFHEPVRTIVDMVIDRIGDDAGIVLFGSVARGDADRASDVDLFVVVEENRMAAQRAAHAIEDDLASERFGGDRYEPHIVVETEDSATTHDRVRDVLTEGLTLRETPALEAVKEEVLSDGA